MAKLDAETIEAKITALYIELGNYSKDIIKLCDEMESLKKLKAGKPEARKAAFEVFKQNSSEENQLVWQSIFEDETLLMQEINVRSNHIAILKFRQKNISNEISKYETMLSELQPQ